MPRLSFITYTKYQTDCAIAVYGKPTAIAQSVSCCTSFVALHFESYACL